MRDRHPRRSREILAARGHGGQDTQLSVPRPPTRVRQPLGDDPCVDLYTVQRAGGWKTPIMVQRYAHLSPDHLRAAVEKLAHGGSNGATGTRTDTAEA